MRKTINVLYQDSLSTKEEEWNLPSLCPHCETGVDFIVHMGFFSNYRRYCAILECPICFNLSFHAGADMTGTRGIPCLYPMSSKTIKASSDILRLSPRFCDIYKEAQLAEQNGFFEICGMGYRKALEVLIKDFLISENPDNKNNIEKEFLGEIIKNRITDIRLKTFAERVAWLGNDETHYVRKHTDRDLNDLKKFLEQVIKYIDSELCFRDAQSILPK